MAGPGFNETDFRTTYRSLDQRPRSGKDGSLFKIAKKNGWRDTTADLRPSLAERELKRREAERVAAKASAKQDENRTDASAKAIKAWNAGSAKIMDHEYYLRKTLGGTRPLFFGEDVRRGPWPQNRWNDALLVPIYGSNSKIMSLEAISSSGDKMALKGGAKSGGLYPLARFTNHESGVVIIAEGLATAAACMQATGFPSVAAFCDSNLKKVAEMCKSMRPALQIVIAADIGSEDMARAAADAVGGILAIPADIPGIVRGTDFWDIWATKDGPRLVKNIIDNALNAAIFKKKVVRMPERRDIQILPGNLPAAVDQAEASLIEQCDDIFQRAGIIVRPVQALINVANGQTVDGVRLSAVDKYHLAERLTRAANWWKLDSRAIDPQPTNCPLNVAQTYMSRDGAWRLKMLEGIITAYTLRPDGSILDAEGYDDRTGLLLYGDQSQFKSYCQFWCLASRIKRPSDWLLSPRFRL